MQRESSGLMIIAVGVRTAYWEPLINRYPSVLNCCIDVRDVLGREYNEDTRKSALSAEVRDRIKEKATWIIVYEACKCVLRKFRLLLVVCKYAKHRSLALGIEFTNDFTGELISPRYSNRGVDFGRLESGQSVNRFLNYLDPHLEQHKHRFQTAEHPLRIHTVSTNFNGPQWSPQNPWTRDYNPLYLHDLRIGDVVVEMIVHDGQHEGWSCGVIVRDREVIGPRWYPNHYVRPMDDWHYQGIEDIHGSMIQQWTEHRRHTQAS